MNNLFTIPNIWDGESFELALEFKSISKNILHTILVKLWNHPFLIGVYLKADLEPDQQEKIILESDVGLTNVCLRGMLKFTDGTITPCSTMAICDEISTWVYLSVPESYFQTKYLIDRHNVLSMVVDKDTEVKVVDWMCELANSIYYEVPFSLGLIGWISGCELNSIDIDQEGIPDDRGFGILLPCNNDLHWIPRGIRGLL